MGLQAIISIVTLFITLVTKSHEPLSKRPRHHDRLSGSRIDRGPRRGSHCRCRGIARGGDGDARYGTFRFRSQGLRRIGLRIAVGFCGEVLERDTRYYFV